MTSLDNNKLWRIIPAITREYTPGAHCNSRKTMRFPTRCEISSDSPALRAEQFHSPNQTWKEPRFAWWNSRESLRTLSKSRRARMSTQKCKIAQCTPNQLKMKPDSPALAPESSCVAHRKWQVAWLPLCNARVSLRHQSQVFRNTNFNKATREKLHAHHIISRCELIPRLRLKR